MGEVQRLTTAAKLATDTPRDAWLDARRQAITATDAGAILGVSKFASRMDVYLDKLGERPEIEQTSWMLAGNRMQRTIIDWWAEQANVGVVHAEPYTFTRKGMSRIGASLDAVRADNNQPIDAKNIGWKTAEWGEEGGDRMPLTYAVQLAVQMHVLDVDHAYLPVLFGGRDLVCYEMERDRDLEASVVGQCLDFWAQYVDTRTPPPVDGSEAWTDYLKRTFAKHTDVVIRATPEQCEAALALHVAKEQLEEVERTVDRLKNELRNAIGANYAIEGPMFRATWALSKDQKGPDYEQAAKDLALKLAEQTGEPATKLFADAAAANIVTKRAGSRSFRFTYKGA